jgi:hypothetical protein
VNGAAVPCDCGPATTCTNGKQGTCSQSKETWYRDNDGDGHGNPAQPAQVCANTPGYARVGDDCDDSASGASFYPGVDVCSSAIERKSCQTGGVTKTDTCDYGCMSGTCRPASDGTIGVPGYVSCGGQSRNCPIAGGCNYGGSACATEAAPGNVQCDGPSDCPGQVCCVESSRGGVKAECYTGACPTSYHQVCDPVNNSVNCNCNIEQSDFPMYSCQ